jgi:pyruvate/2-oxoacid:ferredoxin oxidoreductase alpha subunit
LVVENNISGQLQDVIREQTGLSMKHHYRRYDGRPIYAEDLINKVKEVYNG